MQMIHHFALLLFKNYLTIQVGTLQRIHRQYISDIVQAILMMLNCRLKVISPCNHGSSKCKREIKTISKIIVKQLWDKGQT